MPRARLDMRLADKIAINALSQIGVQVLTTVTAVVGLAVTTRYLSIAQFGEVQAAFALVTTFQFMSDLGLSTIGARILARAAPGEERQVTASLFTASFFYSVVLVVASVVIAVVAYHGSRVLARNAAFILLVPLLFTPWQTVARSQAILQQQLWVTSVITVIARLASVGGLIIAAEYKLSALMVATAYMLGYGLNAVGMIWWKRRALPVFSLRLSAGVRSMVTAGLSLSVITVVNAIYVRLDAVLLSFLSSPRSVALYTVAYRVVDTLTVLPGYVMVTLIPELARLDARDARSVRIVNQAIMSIWLLIMPVGAAVVVAPEITVALGGGRYRAAGVVLMILLPAVVLACLNSVLGNVMVAQSRQGVLLNVSLANLVINGGVNVLLIPRLGAKGAAIALVITEVVSLIATVGLYLRGAGRISMHRFGRSLVAGLACAGGMCVRFAIPDARSHLLLTLACALAAGGVAYVIAVKLLGIIPEPIEALLGRLQARMVRGRAREA